MRNLLDKSLIARCSTRTLKMLQWPGSVQCGVHLHRLHLVSRGSYIDPRSLHGWVRASNPKIEILAGLVSDADGVSLFAAVDVLVGWASRLE